MTDDTDKVTVFVQFPADMFVDIPPLAEILATMTEPTPDANGIEVAAQALWADVHADPWSDTPPLWEHATESKKLAYRHDARVVIKAYLAAQEQQP